jgi:hypothetical protein
MVAIYDDYKDYRPPKQACRSIERLLSTLPEGYLNGLSSVVLTNGSRIGAGKTQRVKGRKFRRSSCLGFYHHADDENGAWIQIVVDNLVGNLPAWFCRSKFLLDMVLAHTVYHEVGHHLDATIGAPARSGEAAADEWARRLTANHFRRRYPIIRRLVGFAISRFKPQIDRQYREVKALMRKHA